MHKKYTELYKWSMKNILSYIEGLSYNYPFSKLQLLFLLPLKVSNTFNKGAKSNNNRQRLTQQSVEVGNTIWCMYSILYIVNVYLPE